MVVIKVFLGRTFVSEYISLWVNFFSFKNFTWVFVVSMKKDTKEDKKPKNVGKLSKEERNRRIDMAAKHTVKEYGEIFERLSKE